MSLRLPSGHEYASQIEKELKWLPKFKSHISFEIPSPIAKGNPTDIYPLPWAINQWIEGESTTYDNVRDLNQIAIDLSKFLKELQSIDASDGPIAGQHNFYRGGDLRVYDKETRNALEKLNGIVHIKALKNIWNRARGWALWKALITYDINNKNSESSLWAESTIKKLLKDIN